MFDLKCGPENIDDRTLELSYNLHYRSAKYVFW